MTETESMVISPFYKTVEQINPSKIKKTLNETATVRVSLKCSEHVNMINSSATVSFSFLPRTLKQRRSSMNKTMK